MTNYLIWTIVALNIIWSFVTTSQIGKPRKPVTAADAGGSVLITLIVVVWAAVATR